ncbi:MAG: hypothetical protein CVV49_02905 [Spirochaetae bacterium HGW-Spirochaetae-5]|nr:MAG: hypothetical protein CVV49_02905 [Spirochaetae bacterium HGW-Spirochaetae-5]
MINKNVIILLLIFIISGCSSIQKPELSETENLKAKELLTVIQGINDSSPETISSSFNADGNNGEKKFRVEGRVAFNKKGYYKIIVLDYIFQSPILEAFRELDRLYFYYPTENKLLVDDIKKIDLNRYTGFKVEFNLLYTLFTGGIPLISNSSVYKCLYDENEKGYNLIIQNEDFFQNIFFKDNVPEKILFVHKLSRHKAEIYLKSMVKKDESIFFRKIKIVIPELNIAVNVDFSRPALNTSVKIEKFNQEKLPKRVEVIVVN